uniref:metallophosphoesterase family protein n=1 Tax=uncultured Draconibacterium sp. TaxID=1573823 RepID=UPI0032180E91
MKSFTSKLFCLLVFSFFSVQLLVANNFTDKDSAQSETLFKTQPFLQNPFEGGVTISWFTNELTHGWVEFGTDQHFGQKAETRIGGQTVANVKHHKIRLENLNPGVTYYYRACSRKVLQYDAYKKNFGDIEYTETYSFKLPDTKLENFTALVFNDLHKHKETLEALLEQVKGVNYDFVIYNGDCIDDPVNEEDALKFISFSNEAVNAAEKPLIYIRGNHEIRGAFSVGLNQIIDYPGGKTFGAFNWGDTRFIILDCGEDKPDNHWVYYGLNNFDELRNSQLTFLEAERKNKAFRNAEKRVLIHHIPIHDSNPKQYAPCSELWSDVLNRSNISVALNAHTHHFAYHEKGSIGNDYPVIIGGGYKKNDATVMVLSKTGKKLSLKVTGADGTILGDYQF